MRYFKNRFLSVLAIIIAVMVGIYLVISAIWFALRILTFLIAFGFVAVLITGIITLIGYFKKDKVDLK